MTALAGDAVQVQSGGGHQRFALAGLHLGDLALVKRDAADHLHVVVALSDGSLGGLAHRGKGFRQEVVQ